MNKAILARIENHGDKKKPGRIKTEAPSNPAPPMKHPFHSHRSKSVATENQDRFPTSSRFMASQRRNTSDLLDTDPDYKEQHARFHSSRGPLKKRLSPKVCHQMENKENIFASSPRVQLHPYKQHLAGKTLQAAKPQKNLVTSNALAANPTGNEACASTNHQRPHPKTSSYCYQPKFRPSRSDDFIARTLPSASLQRNGSYGFYRRSINMEGMRVPPMRHTSPLPSFRGDLSPVHPPTSYINQSKSDDQSSTAPVAPVLLRTCSSRCCEFPHHSMVPPQLKLSMSTGQQLISLPIMQTPDSLSMVFPRLYSTASSCSTGTAAGIHHFSPEATYAGHLGATDHHSVHPHKSLWANNPNQVSGKDPVPQQNAVKEHGDPGVCPETHQRTKHGRDDTLGDSRKRKAEGKNVFYNVRVSQRPCKCAATRCLKLYCECFSNGLFCDSRRCICTDCSNTRTLATTEEREVAIKRILHRRPDAFESRAPRRTGDKCACKKSCCLKKYCECVANKKHCTEKCKCSQCQNRGD